MLPKLLATLFGACVGAAQAEPSLHLEARPGLRVSGGDLSLQLGFGVECGLVAATFDPWVRPFRWSTEVREAPDILSRYHELRYGSTFGLRLRTPGNRRWLAMSGGTEIVAGDWSGTQASPETEFVPWVGLEGLSGNALFRLRFATRSNRLGWGRLEVIFPIVTP